MCPRLVSFLHFPVANGYRTLTWGHLSQSRGVTLASLVAKSVYVGLDIELPCLDKLDKGLGLSLRAECFYTKCLYEPFWLVCVTSGDH